ncbi:histidine kinase [Panacibacter sp. DH6]|uniref:Histidine kinase n=1 Tax=Panacibacter microcysteis TaxID=2793269 RepID=A0A931E2B9_9BACT|nr:histidine kinase [Panacibacter microcysteis]MBG9374837.1 histidine kinase [Panacibacter microcysteis]
MIKLPQYTRQDRLIILIIMPVLAFMVNFVYLGSGYFTLWAFPVATLVSVVAITVAWQVLTWIAVTLRNRFPDDKQLIRRLSIALVLFVIITALTFSGIFWVFSKLSITSNFADETRLKWMLMAGVIINIFITLLHEGISGFEKWKTTITETEALKTEYMQSRLLGLKSQLNPHFLFNSLNSLSCLIHDEPVKAEKFLDEMSKVYRYLLKNSDEQLVDLSTELQFTRSYFYLLKERHGEGLELTIDIEESQMSRQLPPLTLQILLESAFNMNAISKDQPLKIALTVTENGWLQIKNNVQRKLTDTLVDRTGIQNLSKKFRLLCNKYIIVKDTGAYQMINVPLIGEKEEVLI